MKKALSKSFVESAAANGDVLLPKLIAGELQVPDA